MHGRWRKPTAVHRALTARPSPESRRQVWRSGWPACVRSCGTGPTDLNRFDGCLSQSPAVVSVRSAFRPFGIGLVQTAVKLVVEPIFEADFEPNTYGYRPRRSAAGAIKEVHELLCQGYTDVVDADLSKYLDDASYYTPVCAV